MPTFHEKVRDLNRQGKRVCVGLDPDPAKIPPGIPVREFLYRIVDAVAPFVAAFKPNIAFFEGLDDGWELYGSLIARTAKMYPMIPIIGDMKRGDIGNTNRGYVRAAFERFGVDAMTVHPYLGRQSLQVILDHGDKGILVLCRTSNPESDEFQGRIVDVSDDPVLDQEHVPLYQYVAHRVVQWNTLGNCGLIVGATYPKELAEVQKIAPNVFKLIPGVGTQGGELEASVKAAYNPQALPDLVINVSSGVLYAYEKGQFQRDPSDFAGAAAAAAEDYHKQIQAAVRSLAA